MPFLSHNIFFFLNFQFTRRLSLKYVYTHQKQNVCLPRLRNIFKAFLFARVHVHINVSHKLDLNIYAFTQRKNNIMASDNFYFE